MMPAATAEMADDMPMLPEQTAGDAGLWRKRCPLFTGCCFAEKCVKTYSTAAGTVVAPLILAGIIFPAQ